MRVVWTETALGRIEDISAHIALDDPGAATRWVVELFDLVESQLKAFPESGRVVPELGEAAVRELVYGDYRVFYRVGERLEVMTVRHSSQLLREDEVRD